MSPKVALIAAAVVYACSCIHAQTELSEADEQELLNAHNHFRSRVNPIAINMERMVFVANDWLLLCKKNVQGRCW